MNGSAEILIWKKDQYSSAFFRDSPNPGKSHPSRSPIREAFRKWTIQMEQAMVATHGAGINLPHKITGWSFCWVLLLGFIFHHGLHMEHYPG